MMTRHKLTGMLFCAAFGAGVIVAQDPDQPKFPTAVDACHSLDQAVESNDTQAIAKILGGSADLAASHDDATDKQDRETFIEKFKQMHRLGRNPDGSMTLYVGAENWPFPVPLVQENGAWRFEPKAGMQEVLFRRIGRNEMSAIAICHEFVRAKTGKSTSGLEPVKSLAAGSSPALFHGYYFHVLNPGTGGFALIAYPAAYRSSGVMTFAVTAHNVIYEKDLGPQSSAAANAMTAFKKDRTWYATESGK